MKISLKKYANYLILFLLSDVLLASASLTFAADATPPQINITSPATNSHHGQWIGVQISASDDVAVTKVEIYIDGKLKTTLTQAPYNWTWDNFYELDPMHHISAKAYDAGGNVGQSEVVSVIIDDAIPFFSRSQNARSIQNLALNKPSAASKSVGSNPSSFTFNGDSDTGWSSGDFAPQWVEVDLGGKNLIDKIELVVGQFPLVGTARHEIYGSGSGGEEGLLFTIDGKLTDGETMTHEFIPPLRNVKKVKVLTNSSQSYVAWKEIKVLGTPLNSTLSTSINNIYGATYLSVNEYPFANINLTNFTNTVSKLKALGINTVWLVLPWIDFDPNLDGSYNEQALSKLSSMLDYLHAHNIRAVLALNYGSYFDIALFENRNVWKNYQKYISEVAFRYKNYSNLVFMNFSEGAFPSTQIGQVNKRGAVHDESFKQWAYATNSDLNYWNSRWGTAYINWSTVQAFRYEAANPTRCTDDFRWINSRLRQGFGRLPSLQSLYGNVQTPYGYHDFILPEGWTTEAPIPKPNSFDIVSYGFYPATRADCGLNNIQVANTSSGWVSLSELNTKILRLTSNFPGAQVLIGEIGVPTALQGGEADQTNLVNTYLQDIKNKGWGFNFWQAIDYQSTDPTHVYEKTHGLYRTDGTAKPAVLALANLLGGATSPSPFPAPTLSPTPTPSPSPSPKQCSSYVCSDGTQVPACTADGQPISYLVEPCFSHGGQVITNTAIHLINDQGTFYLIQDNLKQGITNPDMLYTYGFEFKDALPATAADLALPEGSPLLPANGSLVKSPIDPTVYLITAGQKKGFVSAQVFTDLGFKFTSILTVTAPELDQLPLGNIISDSTIPHPDGFDVNQDGTIYWINSQTKYGYPSMEVYNSWNIDNDFSRVVPANTADRFLPIGDLVGLRVIK